MLFAGWEVRMVKNCDRGLENTAYSSQYYSILKTEVDSFSPYGPTLSR